ncbi:MAG: 6-phosphofructokinase [Erysipelotrichaceae bacterium]|jgi:6-phosphofructokinase 1|nr:6-phosphofructokinase [Erysipelotrichaceae bacterium]
MIKSVGILTSGGDAPGMNAAIRAVTRAALSNGLKVFGIMDGYQGLVEGRISELQRNSVSDIIMRGGTILGTARLPEFKDLKVREQGVAKLQEKGIDALVVIGGDGTYRGALALHEMGIKCIGLPGTIDNDIACTDFTIGFDTALNTVLESIDKLRDTSASHHRCSIVEVMGNHCGDLALYAGICSGAELVITPETGYDELEVIEKLKALDAAKKRRHAIVVISEKITDVDLLAQKISKVTGFAGRSTVLGHVQRGGSPTGFDRMLATRFGDFAVELLCNDISAHCVGILENKLVSTPFEEAFDFPTPSRKKLFALQGRLA